jgi:ribonuclease Z
MGKQSFELLILGTTSASPGADRNLSGQLLNIAERHCLIDCGEATQIQLRRYKVKFQGIDHIFISHMHGDHIFGLPGLLSSMHLLGRKQALNIYAPAELKELTELTLKLSDTKLNFFIHWRSTDNKGSHMLFEDDKICVHSFPLKHRIACTGFIFREKPLPRKIDKFLLEKHGVSTADIQLLRQGDDVTNAEGEYIQNHMVTKDPDPARAYAYCSDTAYDPELVQWVRGVDLLYHESTFLNDMSERAKKTYHSTAQQAATIAKEANVKHLLLGHFSARYRELDNFQTEAIQIFQPCSLAHDGKKIKI